MELFYAARVGCFFSFVLQGLQKTCMYNANLQLWEE